jgi:hypothetical protein
VRGHQVAELVERLHGWGSAAAMRSVRSWVAAAATQIGREGRRGGEGGDGDVCPSLFSLTRA